MRPRESTVSVTDRPNMMRLYGDLSPFLDRRIMKPMVADARSEIDAVLIRTICACLAYFMMDGF